MQNIKVFFSFYLMIYFNRKQCEKLDRYP
jgi:hypothetical protein